LRTDRYKKSPPKPKLRVNRIQNWSAEGFLDGVAAGALVEEAGVDGGIGAAGGSTGGFNVGFNVGTRPGRSDSMREREGVELREGVARRGVEACVEA
jgi:hypothetical protein